MDIFRHLIIFIEVCLHLIYQQEHHVVYYHHAKTFALPHLMVQSVIVQKVTS